MLTNKCITPLALDWKAAKILQNKELNESVVDGRADRKNDAVLCFNTVEQLIKNYK